MQSFLQKLGFTNLEPKMRYLAVLGSNFEKNIFTFAISVLEFALLQSLGRKTKIPKSGTKSVRFPYFGAGI